MGRLSLSFICLKNLQDNQQNCDDFEIRFCCDKNLTEKTNLNGSVSYSEKDFNTANLTIRLELNISPFISNFVGIFYLRICDEKVIKRKQLQKVRKLLMRLLLDLNVNLAM